MRLKRAVEGILSKLKRTPPPPPPKKAETRVTKAGTRVPKPKTVAPAPLASAQAYCDRGTERLRSGELEAAIADFSSAIGLDAGCAKAYAGRGVALERSGKTDDAKKDYAKSIEIELRVALKAEYGYDVPK